MKRTQDSRYRWYDQYRIRNNRNRNRRAADMGHPLDPLNYDSDRRVKASKFRGRAHFANFKKLKKKLKESLLRTTQD